VAGWPGWARSHFFIVCWNRSTFPWVWGYPANFAGVVDNRAG
jgi:hypothetical protein